MPIFLKRTLRAGIPFGLGLGLFAGLAVGLMQDARTGLTAGLAVGGFTGFFFGLFLAAFITYQAKEFVEETPDFEGEPVLYEGPANHFHRREGTGGWLYLTSGRLHFMTHPVNLQPHELTIRLSEIAEVRLVKTAFRFSNRIEIATTVGASERFVVEENRLWLEAIERTRAEAVES